MQKRGIFDNDAFYAALDAQRQALGYTWRKVASEAGVSASTLTRMAQGKRPDVDSLAALATWARLDVDAFIRATEEDNAEKSSAEPLTMISTYLRSDRNLSDEAARALDELVKTMYARLRKE
jgi:transcriptional regulator with XRE-family HTH domain